MTDMTDMTDMTGHTDPADEPTQDPCGAEGWYDGNEYRCDLPTGHDGKHVDSWEGWTW